MAHAPKRLLVVLGAIAGLLLIAVLVAPRFADVNRYRPRIESAASAALGMDVHVGPLDAGLLPRPHVSAKGARILDSSGTEVASAVSVRCGIALWPLLRGRVQVTRVEVVQPRLQLERSALGRLNVQGLEKAMVLVGALDGARVSVVDCSIAYVDRNSGERLGATGLALDVSGLHVAPPTATAFAPGLALHGKLSCRELRVGALVGTDLRATVTSRNGDVLLDPLTLRLFDGVVSGGIGANLSGAEPLVQVHASLPHVRLEKLLVAGATKPTAEGALDVSVKLSMRGLTRAAWLASATGDVSLSGRDLTLLGTDLDRGFSRFESSQRFNLVDVGAVFLAGPVGVAVTKGYNFANLFRGTGGKTDVHQLVSDWTVERGVARAKDVALATAKHRIALEGRLDFVHERFDDVTFAVISKEGCASVKQVIHGSFAKPVVEKPHTLMAIAGPVMGLLRTARGILPSKPCEMFYEGSVPAPE